MVSIKTFTALNTLVVAMSTYGFARADSRSPPFQIKSIERSDLCIEASILVKQELLTIQQCDDNASKQEWTMDDDGRLHAKDDDTLCVKHGGGTVKLGPCGEAKSYKNLFAFNAFYDTINSRKNGFKTFGIADLNEPLEGKTIRYGRSLSLNTWSIDPPTLFVSKADISSEFQIKSKLNSLCLASSKKGENPRLVECDSSNQHQIWEVDSFGDIGTSRTAGKKCLFYGTDVSALRVGRGACGSSKKSSFMYDAFTSSIIHQRGGDWAFTVDVDLNEVVLGFQDASKKELQEWSLVAV